MSIVSSSFDKANVSVKASSAIGVDVGRISGEFSFELTKLEKGWAAMDFGRLDLELLEVLSFLIRSKHDSFVVSTVGDKDVSYLVR